MGVSYAGLKPLSKKHYKYVVMPAVEMASKTGYFPISLAPFK